MGGWVGGCFKPPFGITGHFSERFDRFCNAPWPTLNDFAPFQKPLRRRSSEASTRPLRRASAAPAAACRAYQNRRSAEAAAGAAAGDPLFGPVVKSVPHLTSGQSHGSVVELGPVRPPGAAADCSFGQRSNAAAANRHLDHR